jgi:hypothetical protein
MNCIARTVLSSPRSTFTGQIDLRDESAWLLRRKTDSHLSREVDPWS